MIHHGIRRLVLLAVLWPVLAWAAQIGDAGHFISQFVPFTYLNNPDGRAFSVTVHRYFWTEPNFNGDYSFTLTAPDGKTAYTLKLPRNASSATVAVPAGQQGVYRLNGALSGYGLCWFESTLEQMVAQCADIGLLRENSPGYTVFMLHAMAPRRWYFYVPPGVKSFEVHTVIGTWQTHREDYGLLVMNPHGQRVAALYGGLSVSKPRLSTPEIVPLTIETDEGTTGRFWSLWITGGDSHNYSDLRVVLKGVPAYLAPSPEQWFDPTTGKAPERLWYDESQIRRLDEKLPLDPLTGKPLSTDSYLWKPTPFLGDEDYNGIVGKATVYFNNPENRQMRFGAASYLVPGDRTMSVRYTLTGPRGERLFEEAKFFRFGKADSSVVIPAAGKGVYRMDVEAKTWYAWCEPAPQMVLAGTRTRHGATFALEMGIARHWFFLVPKGKKSFRVSTRVADPNQVLSLEIHAPDRLMDLRYVRGGRRGDETTVTVPDGLDGKLWSLRTEVGSATRFLSQDAQAPAHPRIAAEITLRDIPGYLAPTWEQWFDPEAEGAR